MANNQVLCIICGQEKGKRSFLKHESNLLNDRFSICKECANNRVDFDDKKTIVEMCQLFNLPYDVALIKSLRETDDLNFGSYLQRVRLKSRFKTFAGFVLQTERTPTGAAMSDDKYKQEMSVKWGAGYKVADYDRFEKTYVDLVSIKEPTTALESKRYVQNVKLKDVLDAALLKGDGKSIPSLQKTYINDLKELGFDSIFNAKDDQQESIGQRIQRWETTRPVPDRKELDDVSNIKQYIQKWFVIPMKRTFGSASEEEVASLYENERK
ncbi:hypothetical protein [Lactobacillus taiwanensis]|uniref:hypothetical protein n=1 Tax=Lactobacillus taiwanensis TaxID=508451 RepID=UPI00321F6E5B